MEEKLIIRIVKITILCLLAAGANYLLTTFMMHSLRFPLYLDTIFSVALCFGVGVIPALAAALLTHIFAGIRDGGFTPFIICSMAEIIIVWLFKPVPSRIKSPVSLLGSLLFLYIALCISVSILGGLVDFVYHGIFSVEKFYFSPEDTIKISLLRGNIHTIAVNILSRIPVNIVDRFFVVFGGYFISRGFLLIKKNYLTKPS